MQVIPKKLAIQSWYMFWDSKIGEETAFRYKSGQATKGKFYAQKFLQQQSY